MQLRIAGLQAVGRPGDVESNLRQLASAAARAAATDVDLLVTPELFVTGYDIGDDIVELAGQDLLTPIREIAREYQVAIVAGAPQAEAGRVYNTAFFVGPEGQVLGQHRKTHLFGEMDRKFFTAGELGVSMVEFCGVRIATMICYDVEFPENARQAALAGAHLIVVPTAQMEPFQFVADHLVRTRAWENQVYVAYVNHAGRERNTIYIGGSSIVAPNGEVLARAGNHDEFFYATVDTEVVAAAQMANPYLADL